MGLFDKLERKLEQTVNGAFAKAFRAEVQPVEIASAMRRAMDDRASSMSKNQRPIVPNVFAVELSDTDFRRLTAYRDELSDELVASAMEHAETQRFTPGGPIAVAFSRNEELETGVFRIRPSTARQVEGIEDEPYDDAAESPGASPGVGSGPGAAPAGAPRALPGVGTASASAPGSASAPPRGAGRPAGSPGAAASGDPAPSAPAGGKDGPRRRAQDRPWLDIDGERYPLMSAMTIVGRDDDADVILDDPGISRHHSEIRVTHDGPHLVVTLKDLGSTNGTFVNGDPIGSARLLDGDRITVGRTAMTIHLGGRR